MRVAAHPEAVRFFLRRGTRAAHESLDSHPALAALMEGTMDSHGYRRLMILFHSFYSFHDGTIERACKQYALDRFGYVYKPRTEILASDLAALSVQPASRRHDTDSNNMPPIGSAASLGGILYVLEGSMLGGSVLCRAAEKLVGDDSGLGIGYWRWCRAAGGERWAMTCDMLENLATDDASAHVMLAGADAAFATFASWLAPWHADKRRTVKIREN